MLSELGMVQNAILQRKTKADLTNEDYPGETIAEANINLEETIEEINNNRTSGEEEITRKDHDDSHYYFLSTENGGLEELGITNSEDAYIVNYETGEVINYTTKLTETGKPLYIYARECDITIRRRKFMTEEIKKQILQLGISKDNILFDEPMSKHTTFKVGGPAECYIKIDDIQDLRHILRFAKQNDIPITILGNGSNVLVLDGGIKGIVLNIRFNKIEMMNLDKKIFANVGAGVKISVFGHLLLKNAITGFEELSGIPGTIGGAVRMNAGAHGKEFKDIVSTVTCMDYDGNIHQFENEDMHFEYRRSMLKDKPYIVLEVHMEFQKGEEKDIKEKMEEYATYRKEKQPMEYPSAGSTFKRGTDFITAKLIDEAGLKGYSIGGAEVSSKHAGFIINKGNATAKDILELIEYVKHEVEEKFDKKIELEIEIMGEN